MNDYICSECKTQLSSEGTEALDHMVTEHGFDPNAIRQENDPYLIPIESNPEGLPEQPQP